MKLEPWQWPEDHWRAIVSRVRAGRPLRPERWQNGARWIAAPLLVITSVLMLALASQRL